MKKQYRPIAVVGLLIILLVSNLSACTSTPSTEGPSGAETIQLSLGASHSAGTGYQWAVPFTTIINSNVDGITVNPISTTGSTENINLIDVGEIQMGITTGAVSYFAYTGQGEWKDKGAFTDFSIMYNTYPDFFHIIVPGDSPINTFADLEGKKVSINTLNSGANQVSTLYFEALGMDPKTDIEPFYLSTTEGSEALQEGSIDALIYIGGMGASVPLELAASRRGMKVISFTDEEINTLCDKYDIIIPRAIPAGTYDGIDSDIETVGGSTVIIVSNSVSEDVVYECVKAVEENHDEFVSAIGVAKDSTAANTVTEWEGKTIPIHPGAARYYKEIGLIQ